MKTETVTKESKPEPADAKLRRIVEADENVSKCQAEVEKLREQLKEAKTDYRDAVDYLRKVINDNQQYMEFE